MNLQDFVSTSLRQIAEGVLDAQHGLRGKAVVNPALLKGTSSEMLKVGLLARQNTEVPVQCVEFDVAVTAAEGSSDEAGGGLAVFNAFLGAKEHNEESASSVSRVKFSVNIQVKGSEEQLGQAGSTVRR